MWYMKSSMIFLAWLRRRTLVVGSGEAYVIKNRMFLRNVLFLISLSIRMAWLVTAKMSSGTIFNTILWIFKPTQNVTLRLNASFKT